MKLRETKLVTFIIVLLSIFLIYIYFSNKEYSYTKNYNVDKFEITESYENEYYKFIISYNNNKYPYLIKSKYSKKRKLIEDITYKEDDEVCILPYSSIIDFYPLCYKDNEIYTYNLSNNILDYEYKNITELNKDYEKIKINYLNGNKYLLYNYKGFYYLNDKDNYNIKIFDKDVYNLDLFYEKDNYLIVPDYSDEHHYNKLYLINTNNKKVKEIGLEDSISFDSTFLGDYKNKIYLFDNKEKIEYSIDLVKNKVEIVNYVTYKEGKLKKVDSSFVEDLIFEKNDINYYNIINNKIYLKIDNKLVKISNLDVSKIIKEYDNEVYYLSNDSLYMYNNTYGEVLLLNNFEWNFNNTNMIFIFK